MWLTASDWLKWYDSWMNDPLTTIDAEQLEQNVNNAFKTVFKCVKHFKEIPACQEVAMEVKDKIENFKPYIPLIQGLRNPGMRSRHWEQVGPACARLSSTNECVWHHTTKISFQKCVSIS